MNAPAEQSRLQLLVDALNTLGGKDAPPDLERSYQGLLYLQEFLELEIKCRFGGDALPALSPLNDLIVALSDTLNGGRPEFLRPSNQKMGPPNYKAKHLAPGAMASAMELLIFAGVGKDEAAKFVADEANERSIGDHKGQEIKIKQVAKWRSRVDDDLSAVATNLYKQVVPPLKVIIAAVPEAERKAAAEDIVKGILNAARSQRASPKHG